MATILWIQIWQIGLNILGPKEFSLHSKLKIFFLQIQNLVLASETNFHQASHPCVTPEFLVQSDIKGLELKLAWELGDRYFPVLFSRSVFSFRLHLSTF